IGRRLRRGGVRTHPFAARRSHRNDHLRQRKRVRLAEIVAALGAKSYFAKPYHSWERGLNEHTNGLVRQYFPKGTDFSTLSNADVQRVEDKLNSRPRKILGYQTPSEVFLMAA